MRKANLLLNQINGIIPSLIVLKIQPMSKKMKKISHIALTEPIGAARLVYTVIFLMMVFASVYFT